MKSRPASPKLFGTDGIRAHAGGYPLDPRTIPAIGRAIGAELGGTVILGCDPRESSPWIGRLLRAGLATVGAGVEDAGVVPTPAVALLTQQADAAGGIMISASHNAYGDNGIKVFAADGRKIENDAEARIEHRVATDDGADAATSFEATSDGDTDDPTPSPLADRYVELLRKRFRSGKWLSRLGIVVDCANGAMSRIAPAMFRTLGAEVHAIHADPDGTNINAGCGAVHPASLLATVKEKTADFGVAFDGDGDRAMFATRAGRLIDGDAVLLLITRNLRRAGKLDNSVVVGTSMTNYALELVLAAEGVRLVRTDVGDRYVFREMLSLRASIGGEPSGHIIFGDFGLSGDGLLTALKLAETIVEGTSSLDALTKDWNPMPQLIRNVPVAEKVPLESLSEVSGKIDEIAGLLRGRGRIVVRYSGTEALLRIMIESDSAETNQAYAADLAALFVRSLGPAGRLSMG